MNKSPSVNLADSQDASQSHNQSSKALASKILVAILCACSFFAGFYAHQSRQINHCKANQGEILMDGSVVICQNSP